MFTNKTIFITGAGSIGVNILWHILEYNIKQVRIMDNNELKLHKIKQEFRDDRIRFIFGDIRDIDRLEIAMRGVDIVFHTAAMKHVWACEENPIDAIKTNILGTQNLIDVCIREKCDKLINISTDKAVNPINVMGATKLLSERLVSTASIYKGKIDTIFTSVRFGNVFGSSGSVIPVFKKQIDNGGPVTITDCNMVRYMMSIDEAVKLIFRAAEIAREDDIFILKMPKLNIDKLAEVMIGDKDIKIVYTGKSREEKIDEKLISDDEMEYAYENDKMYVITSEKNQEYYKSLEFKKYMGSSDKFLSKKNIKRMIDDFY